MPLMVVKIRSSGQNLGGSTSNCGTYFSLQIKEHLKPPTEHARRATEPLINSSYGIRWSKYSLISLLRDSWHKNVFLPLPAKYFSSDYSGRGNCHYEQCPTEEKCGMQSTERHGGRGYHFHVLACIHIVKFFLQAKNVSIEVVGHGQFIAVLGCFLADFQQRYNGKAHLLGSWSPLTVFPMYLRYLKKVELPVAFSLHLSGRNFFQNVFFFFFFPLLPNPPYCWESIWGVCFYTCCGNSLARTSPYCLPFPFRLSSMHLVFFLSPSYIDEQTIFMCFWQHFNFSLEENH